MCDYWLDWSMHKLWVKGIQNGKFYYYLSAGLVETDPEGALAGFDQVVTMEPQKAEW